MKKISWEEVHLDYVLDVMGQDPKVIRDMCNLLDEIEMLTFICSVDVYVCSQLVMTDIEMGEKLKGI